jgi:hypothetical protein
MYLRDLIHEVTITLAKSEGHMISQVEVERQRVFKGIDRPFELGGESRLIRSVITNWMFRKFFYLILKGLHHKISIKPWDAAL